ncbi:MAG TPA: zinc ribbon domain-containing protein [Acidobacteriaceae bacterium]
MAFCNKCGNQLTGNEKFCAQCGADVIAKPSSVTSTTSNVTPTPTPGTPPVQAQPVVSAPPPPPVQPVQYVPAGPTPVAVAYPQVQQAGAAKKGGMMGTLVVLAIVAAIGYYYYTKSHVTPTPTPSPTPPASQPGPQTNPPPAGGGGNNKALQAQQALSAQWQTSNGFIVVTAKWTNTATVNMTSAVMECDQYNAGGTQLAQFRVTLNGPTPPNTWSSYSSVQMGEAAADVSKLNCSIVHVTPAT